MSFYFCNLIPMRALLCLLHCLTKKIEGARDEE